MKRSLMFAGLLLGTSFAFKASAQTTTIPLETKNNALVLQVSKYKELYVEYFGKKLADKTEYELLPGGAKQSGDYTARYNEAYTASGSRNLLEPAVSITHADGNNSLDLKYVSHEMKQVDANISLLSIKLKDPAYPVDVTLFYKIYANEDVIEQWSSIKHQEKGPITLQKYASANLYLKASHYYLTQFHGEWAQEMQPEETELTHGIKTIDTKLGTRANLFMPSVFMVSLDKPAAEDEGKVLYGGLEWSGNFKTDFEVDPIDHLRLISGINNYASAYELQPNVEFTTPAFWYSYSEKGKGAVSRNVQNWARNYKILDGKGDRLTLLNNWESTYFDFNEQKLSELFKSTKALGVDMFLLDDGWFANKYPRNGDAAGLGDWQENKAKLPNGIAGLVKDAKSNGVKFGIWLEPEMVNPKSELYEKHPDWVIKQPNRDEYYFRNQLVLDLANPKVQDYVYGIVDDLFTKNPEVAYIKWDCNAVIYNAYSVHLKSKQSQFYVEYVRGLYNVLAKLRAKYPKVPMMLCSGGGGRVDYGALQYFTEFWPSDNTDPLERIFIQWQYSYFYPVIATSNHVTDWGKQPIKFRVNVAMMGKLGFDIVVAKLPAQDLQYCQDAIKLYNSLKPIVWQGDQYRLADPLTSDVASMQYVDAAKTSSVVFNYLVNNRYRAGSKEPIKFKGLDPTKKYKVNEIDLYPGTKAGVPQGKIYSGDFLMTVGFDPQVKAGRESVVLEVKAI